MAENKMVQFEAGNGGAGSKLKVDVDKILEYRISLFEIQKLLCQFSVPRYDLGQEKRVWVMYKGNPIIEFGVGEICALLKAPTYQLNIYQQNTVDGIHAFMANYTNEIQQLLS